MTPEQEALVEALRVASPTDEYNQPPLSLLRYIPSVRAVILAIAAERDLLKLRCEWQEARAEELLATDGVDDVVANEGPSAVVRQAIAWAEACARKTEAARAAYVAAGGTL